MRRSAILENKWISRSLAPVKPFPSSVHHQRSRKTKRKSIWPKFWIWKKSWNSTDTWRMSFQFQHKQQLLKNSVSSFIKQTRSLKITKSKSITRKKLWKNILSSSCSSDRKRPSKLDTRTKCLKRKLRRFNDFSTVAFKLKNQINKKILLKISKNLRKLKSQKLRWLLNVKPLPEKKFFQKSPLREPSTKEQS